MSVIVNILCAAFIGLFCWLFWQGSVNTAGVNSQTAIILYWCTCYICKDIYRVVAIRAFASD